MPKHIIFCPCWQAQTPFLITNCSAGVFRFPTIGALYGVFQEDLPPYIQLIQYPTPVENHEEEIVSVQEFVRRRKL